MLQEKKLLLYAFIAEARLQTSRILMWQFQWAVMLNALSLAEHLMIIGDWKTLQASQMKRLNES